MLKTILLPLDGSTLAARALPYAATLAQRADASIALVEAVEAHVFPGVDPSDAQIAVTWPCPSIATRACSAATPARESRTGRDHRCRGDRRTAAITACPRRPGPPVPAALQTTTAPPAGLTATAGEKANCPGADSATGGDHEPPGGRLDVITT